MEALTLIFYVSSYYVIERNDMEVVTVTFSTPIAIGVLASLLLFKFTFGLYNSNLFEEIKIDVTLFLFGLMQYLIIYSIL